MRELRRRGHRMVTAPQVRAFWFSCVAFTALATWAQSSVVVPATPVLVALASLALSAMNSPKTSDMPSLIACLAAGHAERSARAAADVGHRGGVQVHDLTARANPPPECWIRLPVR